MSGLKLVLAALLVGSAIADVYMHNPRGSNNRNCRNDNNDRRRNGNRLFDSQNNDKGGYSCPRAYPFSRENNNQNGAVDNLGRLTTSNGIDTDTFFYYEGTDVHIEWTLQHGAGNNENVDTRLLLQYACDTDEVASGDTTYLRSLIKNDLMRDGSPINNNDNDNTNDEATTTIPENANSADCAGSNCPQDGRYGFHETHEWYEWCKQRERNKGLFTADQLPITGNNNNRARNTRQNPNGNRRGLECPEERDYWPYWTPSMWKDIAVGTTSKDLTDCQKDAQNSQNVINKCYCDMTSNAGATPYPIFETDCATKGGTWRCGGAWGLEAPTCWTMEASRDNHLGNTKTGYPNAYNWTLPSPPEGVDKMRCVLRMRYNASTDDFPKNLDRTGNCNPNDYECTNSPVIDRDNREKLTYVNVFGMTDEREKLSLAINTNQYARTFQDRSYVFEIRRRPEALNEMCKKKIININVRGKRGNIVQVYPSVEYDFVPQDVQMEAQDCVHMQWIGSDYNPNRNPNNGEGGPYNPNNVNEAKADRTNLVQFDLLGHNEPLGSTNTKLPNAFFTDEEGNVDYTAMRRMAFLDQNLADCDSFDVLQSRNPNNRQARERDPRNCGKLNSAKTPYFKGGVYKIWAEGTHKFFSTRNNNFSNRSQKLKIVVTECKSNCGGGGLGGGAIAGIVIGVLGAVGLAGFAATRYGPLKDRRFNMPTNMAVPKFHMPAGNGRQQAVAKPAV